MICEDCYKFFDDPSPSTKFHDLYYESAKASALRGCLVCEQARRAIQEHQMSCNNSYYTKRSSTGSQQSLVLVKRWLRNCMDNHEMCARAAEVPLPTRLVQIGYPSENQVRVVDTSSLKGNYVTLSHCWGKVRPLKLMGANREKLYSGFQINHLPKTFREAVEVTKQLGYSYIWIDSLCIIQDSQEDWQIQSSMMHFIYNRAVFNIAATASENCEQGLFRERFPPEPRQIQVTIAYSGHQDAEILLKADHAQKSWEEEYNHFRSPLFSRAWVTQEIAMAKGVLHFDKNGISWDCAQNAASETFPYLLDFGDINYIGPGFKRQVSSVGPLSAKFCDGHSDWRRLVETYSRCEATFQTDKLVALSGLAKLYQEWIGTPYLAGLFLRGANNGSELLWRSENPHERPTIFTAPTWSWASTKSSIVMNAIVRATSHRRMVEVVDVFVKAVTEDQTSQLEGGTLRLRGRLQSLELHEEDCHVTDAISHDGEDFQTIDDLYEDAIEDYKELHSLLIASFRDDTCGAYMILQPSDRKTGEFRRCGIFFKPFNGPLLGTGKKPRIKLPKGSGIIPSWFQFEEDHGDGNFTISII